MAKLCEGAEDGVAACCGTDSYGKDVLLTESKLLRPKRLGKDALRRRVAALLFDSEEVANEGLEEGEEVDTAVAESFRGGSLSANVKRGVGLRPKMELALFLLPNL